MKYKSFSKDAFPKLKSCAQFLQHNHFEALWLENIRLLKEQELAFSFQIDLKDYPIHKTFLHNLLEYFSGAITDSDNREFFINCRKLFTKSESRNPEIPIVKSYTGVQKQLFYDHIPYYTQSINEALQIAKELEKCLLDVEHHLMNDCILDREKYSSFTCKNDVQVRSSKVNNKSGEQNEKGFDSVANKNSNLEIIAQISFSEYSESLISKHNKEGIFTYASASCKTILGYDPEELIGKSIFDFIHKDENELINHIFKNIGTHQKVNGATFRFKNKMNGFTWLESTGRINRDLATGQIVEIQISSKDITIRKNAEHDLDKERQYLRAVLENVHDGIVACDKNGLISFFNRSARDIHGFPEKPIAPEEWASYYDLYLADGKTLMKKEDIPLFKAFQGQTVENIEMVVSPKNGIKRSFLATAKQILTQDNQILGAVAAMHDITEKKEREDKINKKETLLAESQSMAHFGSWEWDLEADTIVWSEELKKIFQYDPKTGEKDLKLKPYIDFVHPDNLNDVKDNFNKVVEKKEPFTLEHKVVLPNGSTRWVLTKVKSIAENNRNILSGILLDITDVKTAELKIKEERHLLHNISIASPDFIYVFDLESKRVIYKNRDIFKSLGYVHEENKNWVMDAISKLIHPDDLEIRNTFNKQVLSLQDKELLETKYRIKDVRDQYRWVSLRSTIFERNSEGEPVQVIELIQDITDKIKAESAIRYREVQLLEAQRLAKAGSFEYDIKKGTLIWSPEMYRIFGHQLDIIPISLQSFENSLHPDDKENVKRAIKESIDGLQNLDLEHRIILPDNSIRYISTRGRILLSKKGKASKLLGSTMDVTDRKEAEDELQRKNQTILNAYQKLELAQKDLHRINSRLEEMVKERTRQLLKTNKVLKEKNKELLVINSDLDNFIYTASHDLKSPISNLEGLINLLHSETKEKQNATESDIMRMISLSINKFKQTIQDLTEITKVQKEVNEKSEVISFYDILEDVKSDINSMILESEAEIVSDFKIKEVPYAVKNLRSIVYNLLTNAIKYRSKERPLIVDFSTERDGHFIILTVKDNGLGIPPEHRVKMFNMFKRFHTHVEGTGIGLYIVKRIIENNGGKIEVESELGKGSSFKVFFNVKELIIYEKI